MAPLCEVLSVFPDLPKLLAVGAEIALDEALQATVPCFRQFGGGNKALRRDERFNIPVNSQFLFRVLNK